mmetsp:Transcript_28349/g.27168  ORF Transcript_28349/g.27168 Transcript_28349/m.27168 type:complete len:500 (-) Transcript_28349:66-1565(-)
MKNMASKAPIRIAIIGGGVTGTSTANKLMSLCKNNELEVVIFDQGGRGPGGRASHRRVNKKDDRVCSDDIPLTSTEAEEFYQFDHGCQFFCSSHEKFKEKVTDWEKKEGNESVQYINTTIKDIKEKDFFGILSGNECYTGVGGMHVISRYEATTAVTKGAVLKSGVRVSKILPTEDKWELMGLGGVAALHDSPEDVASRAFHHSLGIFDMVIVTDASCSFDGWHRASSGIADIKPEFSKFIKSRARVPLFTTMVVFEKSLDLNLDSIVFNLKNMDSESTNSKNTDFKNIGGLWFAAKNSSKSGFISNNFECWTLVSTPEFAVKEISMTTMQDKAINVSGIKTNVFKPQENKYLNNGPALDLVLTFLNEIKKVKKNIQDIKNETDNNNENENENPEIKYLQGQRWGSALPGSFLQKEQLNQDFESDLIYANIEGCVYEKKLPDLNVNSNGFNEKKNYLYDDKLKLFYGGDFCSTRIPGVEAAVLSGLDLADHVYSLIVNQ